MWGLLPFLFAAATWIGNRELGLSNDLVGSGTPAVADGVGGTFLDGLRQLTSQRVIDVGRLVIVEVVANFLDNHGLFLVASVVIGLCLIKDGAARSALGTPSLAVGAMFLGYVAVFLCTPAPLAWHWATAGKRVFFHLAPTIGVLMAEALAQCCSACRIPQYRIGEKV